MTDFSQPLSIDILRVLCGKASVNGLETNGALYLGLSTTTPTETGGNITEPAVGSYARIQMDPADWDDPTAAQPSVLQNAGLEAFVTATANWPGPLTHLVVFDHLTLALEANFVGFTALAASITVNDGDTAEIAAGEAKITLT